MEWIKWTFYILISIVGLSVIVVGGGALFIVAAVIAVVLGLIMTVGIFAAFIKAMVEDKSDQ